MVSALEFDHVHLSLGYVLVGFDEITMHPQFLQAVFARKNGDTFFPAHCVNVSDCN